MKKNVLKKLFCIVLSIAIFAVCIPFTAFATGSSEVNFVIFSDLHYYAKSSVVNPTEFEKFCKLNNSTTYLAPSILDVALATYKVQALRGELDFILLPGDLTRNAEVAAHQELAQKLRQFEIETGVPIYVINGNHDINNDRASSYDGENFVDAPSCTPEQFRQIYAEFGYNEALSTYKPTAGNYEGYLSYTADLPGNYRLIAIDSQMYSADNTDAGLDEQETAGQISATLEAWVLEECAKAKAEGKTIVGLIHHNVVPHFETEVDLFDNFVLRDWERLADNFADAGMNTFFTGHVHMNDVAEYVSDNGNKILDVTTASALNFPNQYRTVTMTTEGDTVTVDYESHDIDEMFPIVYNGVTQPRPIKNYTFGVNFGGSDIKSFVTNLLEFQLRYGFGKDVKDAGGLYNYLAQVLDLDALIADLLQNETLAGIGSAGVKALLFSLCHQLEQAYLSDPEKTIEILDPMLDKLLSIEVSDYPSTKFKSTLGFGSEGDKGTLGDLASTVLAYHYQNDEDYSDDKFMVSALERFNNGENAEAIVDTLFEVILDDLLQGEILKTIKIDPISFGIHSESGDLIKAVVDGINSIIGAEGFSGMGIGDVISIVLMTGLLGDDVKLSDVVFGALDEYLTQSQYDIIDSEFYRILKDFSYDVNPGLKMDYNGSVVVTGKFPVVKTQQNLRIPSNIALTFGEDTASTVNISYFTKYSITRTDIQIVPYSETPDFSNGSTVSANISKNCAAVTREYASIDLGFLGIMYHEININRHTISITGLEAGQKYCYRVGDASRGWWSPVGVIETADNSTAFNFLYVTDPQSVSEKQYAQNWGNVLDIADEKHDPNFIVSAGDMVDHGGDFRQWQRMFNSSTSSIMNNPIMMASGNHETKGDNAQVNNFYYTTLPSQDTTTGVYYSFDYNTAHIAVLNTNELNDDGSLSGAQLEWLKNDMGSSTKAWKFVVLHKAPYSNGSHIDDDDVVALREQLSVLMPELGVDLVFQGHDHVYMRTGVMKDNETVYADTQYLRYNGEYYLSKIEPDGTIYTINGTAGSKHYVPKAEDEYTQYFPKAEFVMEIDIPTYSHIQIDGGNLYFDSYSVDKNGKVTRIDQFAISKVVEIDGTVIDGTKGDNIVPESAVPGPLPGTSSTGFITTISTAFVALVVTGGIALALNMLKRRREEENE